MTGKQRNEISKAGEEQCVDEGTQLEHPEPGRLPSSEYFLPPPPDQGVTPRRFRVFPWSLTWWGKSDSPQHSSGGPQSNPLQVFAGGSYPNSRIICLYTWPMAVPLGRLRKGRHLSQEPDISPMGGEPFTHNSALPQASFVPHNSSSRQF